MISLTADEIDALSIEELIFHVVQHDDEQPILLDETPIGAFEGFFLARVKETLSGNNYEFLPGSTTRKLLAEILDDHRKFVPNSKQLAINFHAARDSRMKSGAIMLIRLCAGPRDFFSLIKFDHEIVVAYDLVGDAQAVLQEIVNNFTATRRAIQKSALIELDNNGLGGLIVTDNTVAYDITQYFRAFLNVHRMLSTSDMTVAVYEAAMQTALLHRAELPKELTERLRETTYHAVQELPSFEPTEFFNKVFGTSSSEKMLRTFQTVLKRKGVQGDTFEFDKQAIKPPSIRKYRTQEGVRLSYGPEAEDSVQINYGTGKKQTRITITTNKLIEE